MKKQRKRKRSRRRQRVRKRKKSSRRKPKRKRSSKKSRKKKTKKKKRKTIKKEKKLKRKLKRKKQQNLRLKELMAEKPKGKSSPIVMVMPNKQKPGQVHLHSSGRAGGSYNAGPSKWVIRNVMEPDNKK